MWKSESMALWVYWGWDKLPFSLLPFLSILFYLMADKRSVLCTSDTSPATSFVWLWVVAGPHNLRGLSCASIILYAIQRRCLYTSHGVAYASNTGRSFYVTALWHMRDYGELPLQFSGLLCQRHCCGKHCQSVYLEEMSQSSLSVSINSNTGRLFCVTALWHMRKHGELHLQFSCPWSL